MENLIPIFFLLMVVVTIIALTYLRHKERLKLIDKGINPYLSYPKSQGTRALFLGLLAVGIGLSFAVALIVNFEDDFVLPACLFLFGGGAFLLYWKLTAGDRATARDYHVEMKKAEEQRLKGKPASALRAGAESSSPHCFTVE